MLCGTHGNVAWLHVVPLSHVTHAHRDTLYRTKHTHTHTPPMIVSFSWFVHIFIQPKQSGLQ